MNGVAQIVGCLLMYGIGKNTSLSLAPWRVLFLICGALTSAAGVVFYILMPNGPRDAWFLDARQKEVLSLRMVQDREGGDKTNFSMAQLRETLSDPKPWFVFAFGVLVTMQSPVLTVKNLCQTHLQCRRIPADCTIVRFPGDQQHWVRQVPYNAIHGSIRRGPDHHALDRGARMRFDAAEPHIRCLGPRASTPGRHHLSLKAVPQRWLGHDRRLVVVILYHCAVVHSHFPYSLQRQRQYETSHRQCHVLHRVLCRVHWGAAVVDAQAAVLLWGCHGYCDVVSIVSHYYLLPTHLWQR